MYRNLAAEVFPSLLPPLSLEQKDETHGRIGLRVVFETAEWREDHHLVIQ